MKDFKVKNAEGKFLGFNLNGSIMEPYFDGISMSYTFTEAEAKGFATLYHASVSPRQEWEAAQKEALDRIFGRKG